MDSFFTSTPSAVVRSAGRWLRRLCVVPLSFVTAFAASEPSLITGEKKSYGYSWEEEIKLGAEADKDVIEKMGVYDDAKLQEYVAAVGQRVLQQSEFGSPSAPEIYRNTKFTFRIIDSPVVNAFAIPGGYVYVTRGLLSHVQNEAQLAVVLGHEIAHVGARHSSQQARRSQWTQLGVIAGAILGSTILGEKGADLAPTLLNIGGQAAEMFLLRYSRDAEHESDTLGVNYATRAGYAAEQSARFFQSLQRLSAAEGKALPSWKSTHPDPGDRAQRVVNIATQVPADTRTNIGEAEYLKHIEGLVMGEDPRQGFANNGVFYHPVLRFQLPVARGWELNNQHAAVIMADPNSQAMMGLRLASATRARDAAQQFVQESKVQVVTSGDTMVNGLPTTVIIAQATADKTTVGVWNAFIELDGRVYSLLGYAPQQAFEQVRPTFESVAAGFSRLRDPNLAGVQPARLKLVRADRTAPFAAFVPTSMPRNMNADELAIINQVSLNDTINEGRVLKIPNVPAQPQIAQSSNYPAAAYPDNRATSSSQQGNYPPQQTYPSQQTYPPQAQTYPPQTYPPQTSTYPPQQTYPQQPSSYPAPTYPPQNYPPQQTYPQPTYPPQGQPQYPPASSTYPPSQTTYPPQPGSYPSQSGTTYPPQGSTYPPQQGSTYPTQPGSPYPPQSGTTYPAQPSYPQFPQPPGATQNRNTTTQPQQQPQQSQPPVWPR